MIGAIADLVALGDESQKLRAEEALKRLDDDPDTRRFAGRWADLRPSSRSSSSASGKYRIYYSRSEPRLPRARDRGKATQNQTSSI